MTITVLFLGENDLIEVRKMNNGEIIATILLFIAILLLGYNEKLRKELWNLEREARKRDKEE